MVLTEFDLEHAVHSDCRTELADLSASASGIAQCRNITLKHKVPSIVMEVPNMDKVDFERFDDQRYPLSYIFRCSHLTGADRPDASRCPDSGMSAGVFLFVYRVRE